MSAATANRQPLTPAPAFETHEKQQELVASPERFRVASWGRRAGKNISAVIDLVEHVRYPWRFEWGTDDPDDYLIWWLGPSYDQANKYGFQTFIAAIPDSWIDDVNRTKPYVVVLSNGVTVEFRTYDRPDSLQGAGVDHMIVDEAYQMPEEVWYSDLDPMLLDTRGSVLFISKPKSRFFKKLYERGESPDFEEWASFHATSADNPFIDENPEDKRGEVPDMVFRQEYLAEFVDDEGDVFGAIDDLLFTLDGPPDEPTPPFVHGWDLARHDDYTVGVVLDADGRLVEFERMRDKSWPQIEDAIRTAARRRDGIVAMDATRDNKLVADIGADHAVEPIKFTRQTKTDLVENLATRVENGELSAYDVPQLRHEMTVFTYEVTPSGNVHYAAPEGYKDDCVDALAMAADQLSQVQAMKRRKDNRDDDRGGVTYI
ncbi:hypothetical protein Z052_01985 [Halorubrum sp. C191]|uniref:phage terminase large subunit family protein n=1 Tax=Halorubrum sp. C191 TaxID=1383842 RepID=UPI000C078D53|nr:terminase family protein [Halorubrum sp. C191]PHQ43933.1 hypothetical protein Z052_01985 [Halorubrum sp. C191]